MLHCLIHSYMKPNHFLRGCASPSAAGRARSGTSLGGLATPLCVGPSSAASIHNSSVAIELGVLAFEPVSRGP
mgnify:CR=1 FL=1